MRRETPDRLFVLFFLVALTPALAESSQPADPVGSHPFQASSLVVAPGCDRISICAADGTYNGQAYAGEGRIWRTDFNARAIQLVDTENGCNVLQACPVPEAGSPSENAFDGTFVYHYNFGTGLLYKIEPSTCSIVSSCDPPGDNYAEGLEFDGEYFWKADSVALYRFTSPPDCAVVQSCPTPEGIGGDGLAVCGDLLVMLGYNGTIYQVNRLTCELVSSCALNDGPLGNGITSDGRSRLFADQPTAIDVVNVDCGVSFEAPQFGLGTPCGEVISASPGIEVTFPVVVSDLDDTDQVTLTASGVPPSATLTPPLPQTGNPASTTFLWTPAVTDLGLHPVTFLGTDLQNNVTTCIVTIDVSSTGNQPPVAVCPEPQIQECTAGQAGVTLDGSGSFDPEAASLAYAWTSGTCALATPDQVVTAAVCPLGMNKASLVVNDGEFDSTPCAAIVEVRDTAPPTGGITFPDSGACFGVDGVPVVVRDSLIDQCDESNIIRAYQPPDGSYVAQGDYVVTLTATDQSGNTSTAQVSFTIDLTAPLVAITETRQFLVPTPSAPMSLVFGAADADGATGGVTWERVLLNGCVLYDGKTYGDGDGLLTDETLMTTVDELCALADRCGFTTLVSPTLVVEAYDCGGARGVDTRTFRGTYRLRPGLCGK
jgi:hypothetical protein